eukprot:TRINITY_DN23442_c0_g1_i1.p2 TRINITY_DN23442_c0_g1~~TRINITY_DN23442_c0_g1_i1.p2  ORF type:complete len:110 (-),score=16.63 TRINITY_DN23442_c0_g1_i1:15-344(-)
MPKCVRARAGSNSSRVTHGSGSAQSPRAHTSIPTAEHRSPRGACAGPPFFTDPPSDDDEMLNFCDLVRAQMSGRITTTLPPRRILCCLTRAQTFGRIMTTLSMQRGLEC